MKRLSPSVCAALLVLITAASLAPFASKAFHMDDPLFLWTARQIQTKPFDFYGFTVNWYGEEAPMSEVTKNPPLAAYYLAGAASVLGWGERGLHLAFLLPAIAVVLGTYALARGFCSQPVLAALVVALSPVFLLSSTSLMCDTMMLAFWVWAACFWVRGLNRNNQGFLALSAVLAALCFLSKYFGLSLLPLLAFYALSKRRRFRQWAPFLLIPLAVLLAYEKITTNLYGSGLLSQAATYSHHIRDASECGPLLGLLIGLTFLGGCIVSALFFAPFLWSRCWLMLLGGVTILCLLPVILGERIGWFSLHTINGFRWDVMAQMSLFVFSGVSLLAVAATGLWQAYHPEVGGARRSPGSAEPQFCADQPATPRRAGSLPADDTVAAGKAETWLLVLWCGGTFLFASILNWTVNGRSLLPLTPAAAILFARRLEAARGWITMRRRGSLVLPVLLSALVGLGVTWADFRLANSARRVVETLRSGFPTGKQHVWFQGHWGFQYYMESAGARAIDFLSSKLSPGDTLVSPHAGTNLQRPGEGVELVRKVVSPTCGWLTTCNDGAGAGFYSDLFGPLPYAIVGERPEEYGIYRVTNSLAFGTTPEPDTPAQRYFRRGMTLARNGDWEAAVRQFRFAVNLNPGFAEAHHQWGMTLLFQQKAAEALNHWRQAVRLSPTWPEPLNNLAWVLATDPHPELRNGAEALHLASRAAALTGTNDVRILDTLAAAYAETGDFGKAVGTAIKAQTLAIAQGRQTLAGQLAQHIELYRSRRPYREEAKAK